ncbi:transient receptor potential cation channel subfamily M member 2 isoform X3 [Magallana gigas]|uniref:transient receptor potential cation channel subfamily M member 2 isoform X3 n=1 Tax=Magallana gigas TaxID=29159 RepID=UPI0033413034
MSKNTSTASKSQNTQNISDATTDAEKTWDDILDVVKSTPTMVFSVIGDSDSFVPRPWPKTVFQTALIEAAKSGGETWILYRGNKQGVSKVVTDAYKHYGNMEFKTEHKDIGHQDRHIKLVSIVGKETIQLSAEERKKAYIHKAIHGKGDGSKFLISFESFVSEQEVSFFSQKMESKMPIPIAIILCEGDIDDIAHVNEALQRKLPVIVMKGSGKAADLVSAYLENPNDLRKKASVLFGIRFDGEQYTELIQHMQSIKEKSDLVGVFDLHNNDPLMLSNVVGEAVVSCWSIEKLLPGKNDDIEDDDTDERISDLLLWTIFANRKKLAEIFWLKSKNHLLTGLICAAILQKLSKKADNVKEQILSNELENHSKLFEQRCISIMDIMFEEDTRNAIDLMDDEATIWGIHSSPLTFAYENFMYDVVAHTCSQKNMNKQWYNTLAPDLKPFMMSAISKPKLFFTAPLTKYVFNYMMFFTMLVMYSAFVLTSISTKYYVLDIARVFEYYVYFWGAGDFIEELISCFGCLETRGRSHRNWWSRMKRYLYDFWNLVDLLSYALLIAALFVRHFYIDETFTIARRMFALSLLVMYLRFLEVFLIHRKMGPTLIMIKEMLKDLLGFLILAVFVVLGVGIYYHANIWPDHQTIWNGDWTNWRIWTIIYYPYWQLYAELNLESLDGSDQSDCTNITSIWEADPSINRCPQEDWTVQAVAAIYLLFSNLLLVNLVIAMFSYTFERVQENSEKLWRFERYTVINDYDWRIPSPINLIFLPYRFIVRPGICCLKDDNDSRYHLLKEYRQNFQEVTALKILDKL